MQTWNLEPLENQRFKMHMEIWTQTSQNQSSNMI